VRNGGGRAVCWSASADLAAGSVVAGIGLVAVAVARDRRDVPLAALPVLLGVHQLIESHIWSESAGEGSVLRGPAVTAWTFIAFVLLPVFVPAALLYAERERRRVQYVAAAIGLPVAAVMGFAIRSGVHATDRGHVLEYGAGVPLQSVVLAGYLFATCVPFLTSPEPTLRELGVALVIGAAIAAAIDVLAFASIWCAFAALVSVLVVRRTAHAARRPTPALTGSRPGRA
jgi:hypothetical protein